MGGPGHAHSGELCLAGVSEGGVINDVSSMELQDEKRQRLGFCRADVKGGFFLLIGVGD